MNARHPRRVRRSVLFALAASVALHGERSARGAVHTPSPATAALADRVESLALVAERRNMPEPLWQEVAAIEQACEQLNPAEPRYPQAAATACTKAADGPGAIAALKAYLTLVPDDFVAQVQLIDLNATLREQTAEATIGYLRGLLGKTGLAASVRSHVAVMLARNYSDRSQQAEANRALDIALHLNPLNPDALRLRYAMLSNPTPANQVQVLLQMLRSNPRNPEVALRIGEQLADVGLVTDSVQFYASANFLYTVTGSLRPASLAIGAGAELVLAGQPKEAIALVQQFLASQPGNADAWNIRLAVEQHEPATKDSFDNLARIGVAAMENRLQSIRSMIGAPEATTRPLDTANPPTDADLTVPDLSGDEALLAKSERPQLSDAYIAALQDQAWLRLYFRHDAGPATQALLDELSHLLGDDDKILARLVGWEYLVQGKTDQAMNKLQAVANTDPYAMLGVIELELKQTGMSKDAQVKAKLVLAMHPTNAVAAVLYCALNDQGAQVIPVQAATPVEGLLNNFPKNWITLITQPDTNFAVIADPIQSVVGLGEPMLARLTIENLTDDDIAISDNGDLTPQVLISAEAHGLVEQTINDVGIVPIWHRLVLHSREPFSQVIRLDRGPMQTLLATNAGDPVDVNFIITFNPVETKSGLAAGAGGFSVRVSSMMERSAAPVHSADDAKALFTQLGDPDALKRFQAAEALAYMKSSIPADDQSAQPLAQQVGDALIKVGASDVDPAVRTWTRFLVGLTTPVSGLPNFVQTMTQSRFWLDRLLGLYLAQRLSDLGKDADTQLLQDPDATVRAYAAGALALANEPPPPTEGPAPADSSGAPASASPAAPPTP